MRLFPEPVVFEWDKGNKDKNLKKHGITNKEAEEVFEDEDKYVFEDESHSQKEQRYGLFGKIKNGERLSIVFTIRKDKVRIVTARTMSKKERSEYEKIKKNT